MLNRQEFGAGTNPREGSSALRLRAEVADTGRVELSFPAVTGRSYTVLGRPAVGEGNWEVVARVETSACDCEVRGVDGGLAGGTARFYRVVTPRLP